MARYAIIFFILFACASCFSPRDIDPPERGRLYEMMEALEEVDQVDQVETSRVTLVAESISMADFAGLVYDQTGQSLVYSSQLESVSLTLDVHDKPLDAVLASVARRYGESLTRIDDLWYIGDQRPEDRSVYVTRFTRYDAQTTREALSALTSSEGKVVVGLDGLVVASDRIEVIQRIRQTLDAMQQATECTWVAQFHLVRTSDRVMSELGLDVTHLAKLSWASIGELGHAPSSKPIAEVALTSTLKLSAEDSVSAVVVSPLMLTTEGRASTWSSGDRIPIPQRAVNESGVIVTTGYEYVQTGISSEIVVRPVRDQARVEVDLELSQVTDIIDTAPVVESERLTSTAIVGPGLYLVGSLDIAKDRRGKSGPWIFTARRSEQERDRLLVWLRVYRTQRLAHRGMMQYGLDPKPKP